MYVAPLGSHEVRVGEPLVLPLVVSPGAAAELQWSVLSAPAGLAVVHEGEQRSVVWTPTVFDLATVPVGAQRQPGPWHDVTLKGCAAVQCATTTGQVRAVPTPPSTAP